MSGIEQRCDRGPIAIDLTGVTAKLSQPETPTSNRPLIITMNMARR